MAGKKGRSGGRREGAGRKALLTYMQKIAVGARWQRLWGEARQGNEDAAIHAATRMVRWEWEQMPNPDDYPDRQALASARKAWIKANRVDHVEDMKDARAEDRRKYPTINPKRPKSGKQITAQVAAEFGITKRMVEECRDEYRALERDLEADTG